MKKQLAAICFAILSIALTTSVANAETICEASLTGYTFMGGGSAYTNPAKDYFMTGNPDKDGTMWGFGWLKFEDLPTESVDAAYLNLEVYQDMNGTLTSANPMDVAIYAVSADVADIIGTDATGTGITTADFKDDYIADSAVASTTITGAGIYSWDITSLVNGWIAGDANNGLVVTGWDSTSTVGFVHPYFAGLSSSNGMSPTLSTSAVPEPSTIALIFSAIACCGGMIVRKRQAA